MKVGCVSADISRWCLLVSGVCGVPIREAVPPALHLSEEEPQEEADGLLLFLHVCEISLWAAQLHRPSCHGHPCECSSAFHPLICRNSCSKSFFFISGKAKADQKNHHLLPVLQRWLRHSVVHRRSCPRSRYPRGGLDHPVWPTWWS